ncbi:hypothetical protein ACTXM3_15735 [Glutamicibacter arilaitensis]|uniref:Uncharacterized protein n=3 Tax=Glutamicibacter arilaitensis TaxID=256701 RepID=A0A2N7RZN4_9MICC|nr:hypothetical protein [Glutamicibacter arilaitensis]PMQ19354.1 hypothetical protein CIK84_11680 [Glutamicibacter arilaitensis]
MIIAGDLACRIPSENAVKIERFFCTVNYPVDSANSQTWAAWIGVAVALLAVIFARKAWTAARDSNGIAERNLKQADEGLIKQLEETRIGLEKQIYAAQHLSFRERELDRLQVYVEGLMRLVNSSSNYAERLGGQTEFEHDTGEVTILWGAWSAHLIAGDPELRKATSVMHEHYVEKSSEIQAIAKKIAKNDWEGFTQQQLTETLNETYEFQRKLFEAVSRYVATLQQIAYEGANHDLARTSIIGDSATVSANASTGK